MKGEMVCPRCGYDFSIDGREDALCPLCAGQWEAWELLFAPIPLPDVREAIASWIGQLSYPAAFEIHASAQGVRLRLYTPPGKAEGVTNAWASMTQQQTRWRPLPGEAQPFDAPEGQLYVLRTQAQLPSLALTDGDPLLALGGQLLSLARAQGAPAALRLWLLGKDTALQERLRSLAAYSYGTEGGVGGDTPNPWGLRLLLLRGVLFLGLLVAGASGGSYGAGWLPGAGALLGMASGGALVLVAGLGMLQWMRWRSIPKDVLEERLGGTLFQVGVTLQVASPQELVLLAGEGRWARMTAPEWPGVRAAAMPLPAVEVAALVSPPEAGEGSGVLDREVVQDTPSPPASQALLDAPFKIGVSVATGEPVGVDPDGHGMAVGGSRTGKSSFAYDMLRQLVARGEQAPGIFLVDPHVSLADAFLKIVDELPPDLRAQGIKRLRVVTIDRPEVVPLNLLAIPDFSWAGNAIVQIGRRIWDDYWGPRMQAALLGLFRLAHVWNQRQQDVRMGLLHVVFAAFNADWRHSTMAYLDPIDRMGTLALDALLGQLGDKYGNWSQGWVTEVISPVLSKVMALELSPWLFAALHQDRFVDLEKWIREKQWIVLRLPAGDMGREGARLTAGVLYNVFDAAFRKATRYEPIPFYFIVDEAQEIATGMRLEAMLSEGAKFGARMFVMAQSLAMMRRVEGFEPVVQSMLANTSTQAFFSPDPEDADTIRAALSSSVRYGPTTADVPSLHCWLRARLAGRWQPPTVVKIEPLARADPDRTQAIIQEVIAAHPEDYAAPDGWQEQAVRALVEIVPPPQKGLLDELLTPKFIQGSQPPAPAAAAAPETSGREHKRLGF